METTPETTETNPYLVIVSKKVRNLKKKLDKIKQYEAKASSGTALNEEQLALVSSKSSVEKSLTDIESVRIQIQEIANELALTNPKPTVVDTESNTNPPPEAAVATTQVDSLVVSEVATQSETAQSTLTAETSTAGYSGGISYESIQEEITEKLQLSLDKVFLALHVCSRYKEVTGKDLPENVDFFGKSLLGLTSIQGFRDTVDKSVQSVKWYLDEEVGKDHEVIRGISFYAMSIMIQDLAKQMDNSYGFTVPIVPVSVPETVIHPSNPNSVEVENIKPNINFYYDTAPDPLDNTPETTKDVEVPVENDNVIPHEQGDQKRRRNRDNKPRQRPQGPNDAPFNENEKAQVQTEVQGNRRPRNRENPRPKNGHEADHDGKAVNDEMQRGEGKSERRRERNRKPRSAPNEAGGDARSEAVSDSPFEASHAATTDPSKDADNAPKMNVWDARAAQAKAEAAAAAASRPQKIYEKRPNGFKGPRPEGGRSPTEGHDEAKSGRPFRPRNFQKRPNEGDAAAAPAGIIPKPEHKTPYVPKQSSGPREERPSGPRPPRPNSHAMNSRPAGSVSQRPPADKPKA